jgi:hypothetical protein
VFCLEEVELEVPMGRDTQVPLAHGGKDGRLCNGVGVKVVELHLILEGERLQEPARRNPQPPLMERHKAKNIARERIWHADELVMGQRRPSSMSSSSLP